MRIVLLGAPGSGKGTQGEKLVTQFGIPKISTGDALRAAVAERTVLGKQAKAAMDAGELVADDIVIGIVDERLQQPDARKGFILDGFPRNTAQAETLDAMLKRMGSGGITHALHLHVNDEEIVSRLLERATIEGRADDKEDVIRNRIDIYNAETLPLIAYYRAQGVAHTVDGIGSLEEVFQRLATVVSH